jgi:predicted RNase H-like HicB family nuclease
MTDYEISIFYSAEDSGYIAEIRELPLCSAFGSTPASALAELEIARDAWLEAARADGRPIPEPRPHRAHAAS